MDIALIIRISKRQNPKSRGLSKDRRGDLPAGIAVNAGRVDEEIARDVFGDTFLRIGHERASYHLFYVEL
jgi:hypothetical protein